ncbi:hypothetical protein [Haladaptatus salinisoli]|uniref:hypothetical protein n=1 Tax=Haladaptatus salinisoli TaxID=2884876 RepID=UPI001D0BB68B|nr:hypothetical protein [Haladaptatus salinisoli]
MVSKRFLRESRELIERGDGRYKFLQHRDERCLSALVAAGRGVVAVRGVPSADKAAYLDALGEINDHYFEARAFERDVRGKFYRYDEEAERRFRSAVAERLSRSVEQLRRLLSAHDALLESADRVGVTSASGDGAAKTVDRDGSEASGRTVSRKRGTTLARQTNRAVRGGWYPVVEAYDHALDPGERIAEGKRRRRQRLYGQQSVPGVVQLLDTPLFERVAGDDLARLRELDRFAPADAHKIAHRLRDRHRWLLAE